jgi:hypothetical protein
MRRNKDSTPTLLDDHPYLRQTLDLIADKWVVAALYVLSLERMSGLAAVLSFAQAFQLARALRSVREVS